MVAAEKACAAHSRVTRPTRERREVPAGGPRSHHAHDTSLTPPLAPRRRGHPVRRPRDRRRRRSAARHRRAEAGGTADRGLGPARTPAVSADGRLVVFAGDRPRPTGGRAPCACSTAPPATTTELTEPVAGCAPATACARRSAPTVATSVVTEIPYDLFRDDDIGDRWDVYQLTLPACGGTLGTWELISSRAEDTFGSAAGDDADPDAPRRSPAVGRSSPTPASSRAKAPDGRSASSSSTSRSRSASRDARAPLPVARRRRPTPTSATPACTNHRSPTTAGSSPSPPTPTRRAGARLVLGDAPVASPARRCTCGTAGDGSDHRGARRLLPPRPDGTANGEAGSPSISPDGRYVAFERTAVNLVIGASLPAVQRQPCPPQVYRLDRDDGTVALVSRVPAAPGATPVAADAGGHDPAISFDGSMVTFVTRATNLFDVQAAPTLDADGGEVVSAAVDAGTLRAPRCSPTAPVRRPSPRPRRGPRPTAARWSSRPRRPAPSTPPRPTRRRPHVVVATHLPKVTVAPLDVGTVAVGAPSGTRFVSVANAGPTPFVPATITSSNPDFAVIDGGTCQLGVAVPAGASCTVYVVLTPSTAGPKQGTLTVAESGFGATSATLQLRGGGGVGVAGRTRRWLRLRHRPGRLVLGGVHPAGGQLRPRWGQPRRRRRGRDRPDRLHGHGHDVCRHARGRRPAAPSTSPSPRPSAASGWPTSGCRGYGRVRGDGRRRCGRLLVGLAGDRCRSGGRRWAHRRRRLRLPAEHADHAVVVRRLRWLVPR